jgi:glutathione S-transferase
MKDIGGLGCGIRAAGPANVERQVGTGPFISGDKLNVADIKLYVIVRRFASGTVDHVRTTVFDHCPKLKRLCAAVSVDAIV